MTNADGHPKNEDQHLDVARVSGVDGQEEKAASPTVLFNGLHPREHDLPPEEEFAQAIIDTMREALLVLTIDLHVKSANHAFYRMFHVTPEETEGRLIYELGNNQWDIPELRTLLEDVLPDNKVFNGYEVAHDFELIGKRVMLLNARRLDHMKFILLAIEDITGRRLAEQAKRIVEERYQTALETSPIVVANVDQDLRYDWVFIATPGIEASSYLGKRDDEIRSGAGVSELMDMKRRVFWEGKQERQEIVFGGTHPGTYEITLTPVLDDWGEVVGLNMVSLDITGRKEAEAQLRFQADVLARMGDAVIATDQEFRTVYLNAAAAARYHLDPAKAFGHRLEEFYEYRWSSPDEEAAAMAALAETGQWKGENVHVVKATGEEIPVESVVSVMRDAQGQPLGLLAVIRDINERKQAEEAMRQMNATLEQRVQERTRQVHMLASTLTMAEQEERQRVSQILHDDLQQRLYGIQMKIGLARQSAEASQAEKQFQQLSEAEAWLLQAIQTTRQLAVELSPPVLKNEGLADVLAWLASQMRELHGLRVEINADHAYRMENVEMRSLLFQAVRELLFNVVKHAGTDQATITLESTDDQLAIHVVDNGCGFDVQRAATHDGHHSAYGLFSMRERLQLFGGEIEVLSGRNRGTHVVVRVPIDVTKPAFPLGSTDLNLASSAGEMPAR